MNKVLGLSLLGMTVVLAGCVGPASNDPALDKVGALPTTAERAGDAPHVRLQDDQVKDPYNQRNCTPEVQARGEC